MLIGFFKQPEEQDCRCRVIKFSDRIFMTEDGDARVLREFVLEVLADSPRPLKAVVLLLPVANLMAAEEMSDSLLDAGNPLNDRGSQGRWKVVQPPQAVAGADLTPSSVAVINDDGLDGLKVFVGSAVTADKFVNRSSRLMVTFPKALEPGNKCAVKVGFTVTSLFERTNLPEREAEYDLKVEYFDASVYPDVVAAAGGAGAEIEVRATLGNLLGGFDIFLYFPHTLQVGAIAPHGDKTKDKVGPDGAEQEPPMTKIMWRARKICEGADVLSVEKTRFAVECSEIGKPDTLSQDVADLRSQVEQFTESFMLSLTGVKKEIRWGTRLAVLSLLVAIGAFAYSCSQPKAETVRDAGRAEGAIWEGTGVDQARPV